MKIDIDDLLPILTDTSSHSPGKALVAVLAVFDIELRVAEEIDAVWSSFYNKELIQTIDEKDAEIAALKAKVDNYILDYESFLT